MKESCQVISTLIHYIAKQVFSVPDENNLVYECLFVFGSENNKHCFPHFVNFIAGEYIDASIEQFNTNKINVSFSPYTDNAQCYTKLEKREPVVYTGIEDLIDIYNKTVGRQSQ